MWFITCKLIASRVAFLVFQSVVVRYKSLRVDKVEIKSFWSWECSNKLESVVRCAKAYHAYLLVALLVAP